MAEPDLIHITNGSDEKLRRAIGRALLRFHATNKADLGAMAIMTVAATQLLDGAWHGFRGLTDPPLPPELFGELMRQVGEQVARGEHMVPDTLR